MRKQRGSAALLTNWAKANYQNASAEDISDFSDDGSQWYVEGNSFSGGYSSLELLLSVVH